MTEPNSQIARISDMSRKVMQLARDTITVQFRFFDTALAATQIVEKPMLNGYVRDRNVLYYDPAVLLGDYLKEPNIAVRLLLHVLFHGIFLHAYRYDKTNEEYWNIACDIAVENTILSMELPYASLTRDDEARIRIAKLKKWVPGITADKLYREFAVNGISNEAHEEYLRLFSLDYHKPRVEYKEDPETIISEEDFKKIAERVKAELKSFSQKSAGEETITENLEESTKTRYDYGELLRRFAVQGEEIRINPDEFDLIFYTYGLSHYGNMPLIEPLEYTETKRVREFVIVLDTSASCRGELLRGFLERTYEILTSTGNFFHKINIHIIQCDHEVREDRIITSAAEMEEYAKNARMSGFGATDFRPVFDYVDELVADKKFENLKGLIYFTDGYGIYPNKAPKYDVIFAFTNEDKNRMPIPTWAMSTVIETDV
ncbi:MAG: VWA-like domain-containing protein [Lachnospiraceae bacterium]|nr:VWA-like domain-containing protein [Lachnospiraceae bacterium]